KLFGLMWIIAIVITIFTIIYFVSDGRKKMKEKEQALQLAKERLAKGEISTKQYEESRKRIQDESSYMQYCLIPFYKSNAIFYTTYQRIFPVPPLLSSHLTIYELDCLQTIKTAITYINKRMTHCKNDSRACVILIKRARTYSLIDCRYV